uniref:Glycosyltransferase family 18 catalytic domain-containing protein n=1 Tax=Moniliophthora roreri TaxID=221103 RepID=A0A0W0FSY6_MONRR
MRPLQQLVSSRKRYSALAVLVLGVVLASVFYREEIQSAASNVVTLSFPSNAKIHWNSTATTSTSDMTGINSSSTEEANQIQTHVAAAPSPTTIENNHITYPRLPLPDEEEVDVLRDKHIRRIEEVIAGEIPTYYEWNAGQLERLKEYWPKVGAIGRFEQPKVILASSCSTTGEVIWLESLINIFRENNQYLLYASYDNLGKFYKSLGDIVTHVWSMDNEVVWCFNDTIGCVESPENPSGIPPWKIFTFTFWGSPQGWGNFFAPHEPWSYNPLGEEWNVVPYKMPDKHFYLGYQFTGCGDLPYIPTAERKDQVAILAKRSGYFYKDVFLQTDVLAALKNRTGLELISVSSSEEGFPVPDTLTLLGPLSRHDYDLMLGSSKALLGIGRPRMSPSPYASLCRGVPVIVPYKGKKCAARPGSSDWCGLIMDHHQHGPAADIGPPYVYTVDCQGPIEDIIDTVMTAVNTPIEPYVPPDMTKEALTQRVEDYFSIDWKAYAMERMREKDWERVVTQEFMYRWLEKYPLKAQKT